MRDNSLENLEQRLKYFDRFLKVLECRDHIHLLQELYQNSRFRARRKLVEVYPQAKAKRMKLFGLDLEI
jgi:hypothetical protein